MARNQLDTLISGATEDNDVVGADSLRFTTTAGYASAVAVIVGASLPILDKVTDLNVSESLKIAMIGLIGAGVLAWAIASAGDVLARAYATAHVHPAETVNSEKKPPRPAAEYIADQLIDAVTKAAPTIKAEVKSVAAALTTSPAGTVFPLANVVRAKVNMHECQLVAVRRDTADPDKFEYLVARPDMKLEWESEDEVEAA